MMDSNLGRDTQTNLIHVVHNTYRFVYKQDKTRMFGSINILQSVNKLDVASIEAMKQPHSSVNWRFLMNLHFCGISLQLLRSEDAQFSHYTFCCSAKSCDKDICHALKHLSNIVFVRLVSRIVILSQLVLKRQSSGNRNRVTLSVSISIMLLLFGDFD